MSWSGRREWMVELRMGKRLSAAEMAERCKINEKLLEMVEAGAITHPEIAGRIARCYGMDVHQYNELVHPDRRASVLPKWVDPPALKGFTWCDYHRKYVAGSEAI